ncbi:hypothetical protein TPHA_0O01540 [Tetrapisispora phaffii CBS 4417]|uniref:BZIP domain-containing protein n=1 Tax=Tetrapisispora phaffii (strain ATCC 24235 / CBS 4417 / NBRC 1672 / NRRL Y-8282 / UCD 70-5) TaxID=1071381 RepID=G8C1U3_TETPH|nr:hypothetical protein TPHA_0O01540 [Tetrapisispora phaffii CBS 4417]CCE66121.1 hypothetical protein TPHA_0O01540 [Tetrapisispora phaffii CBS 4417]
MLAQTQTAFTNTLNNTNKSASVSSGVRTTPNFYINSGLTPNESSLRTGLTPLSQTVPTMLPVLGNNGAALNSAAAPFTPGLTTLLGYSSAQPLPTSMGMMGNGSGFTPGGIRPSPPLNINNGTKVLDNVTKVVVGGGSNSGSAGDSVASGPLNSSGDPTAEKTKAKRVQKPKANGRKAGTTKKKKGAKAKANSESKEVVQKRMEFLERNRLAASKFRQRKKEYIKKIEDELDFYKSEYRELTQIVDKIIGHDDNKSILEGLENLMAANDPIKALELVNSIKI